MFHKKGKEHEPRSKSPKHHLTDRVGELEKLVRQIICDHEDNTLSVRYTDITTWSLICCNCEKVLEIFCTQKEMYQAKLSIVKKRGLKNAKEIKKLIALIKKEE